MRLMAHWVEFKSAGGGLSPSALAYYQAGVTVKQSELSLRELTPGRDGVFSIMAGPRRTGSVYCDKDTSGPV